MKLDNKNLEKLSDFKGYLDNDRVSDLFDVFGIKFAAGNWCAGDFVDRFATEGYNEGLSSDILDQIPRVAAAKIEGIEFHDNIFLDDKGNINEDIITEVLEALDEYGLTPTNMNTNLWGIPKWKLGGVTNPNKKIREDAIETLYNA
ncbi:MAG: sugar isomerase, partial [Candidatus Lokiarchaeota archaeon]|nr:sugar isomerase [Candidatus Lokiarchaeota archaeon]